MNLMEKNKKVIESVLKTAEEQKKMRESFKKSFGFEMDDDKRFPVLEDSFSFKEAMNQISKSEKFREADSSSAFVQLLRSGIQTIVNNMYQVVDTTFDKWATVTQSKKDTEIYAPLHGVGFPKEVARQGKYSEVHMAGMDIQLKNRKYGSIFAVEWELNEDDQTGQVQTQAGLLGEYMKILLEVLVMGKLASISGGVDYAELHVPVSETKPSTESSWPWSTALVGGGATKSSAAALTQAALQTARQKLLSQKNLLGLKMAVMPDSLLIGPAKEYDAAALANSAFWPSTVGTSAGPVGAWGAINPLQGLFKPLISKFMFKNDGTVNGDSTAWYLMDTKKPWFIVQMREAASVVAEAPNAGQSFEMDVMRFKGRMRCNADIIDPRFCFQGSDGSA